MHGQTKNEPLALGLIKKCEACGGGGQDAARAHTRAAAMCLATCDCMYVLQTLERVLSV